MILLNVIAQLVVAVKPDDEPTACPGWPFASFKRPGTAARQLTRRWNMSKKKGQGDTRVPLTALLASNGDNTRSCCRELCNEHNAFLLEHVLESSLMAERFTILYASTPKSKTQSRRARLEGIHERVGNVTRE